MFKCFYGRSWCEMYLCPISQFVHFIAFENCLCCLRVTNLPRHFMISAARIHRATISLSLIRYFSFYTVHLCPNIHNNVSITLNTTMVTYRTYVMGTCPDSTEDVTWRVNFPECIRKLPTNGGAAINTLA